MSEFKNRAVTPINEGDEDLCRALWISVAIQALLDAKGRNVNPAQQAHARAWIAAREGINSEFAMICDLAGIDFEQTRRAFREMLNGHMQVVDFRCAKKALFKNRASENRKRYFRRAAKNLEERQKEVYEHNKLVRKI